VLLTSQSDESLVALVRAGHERAFTAIVERYRPELYALARRLSADGAGEDVLQQAFLGAFAALRAGAEVEHLRGWLYRIVRNSAARSRRPGCVSLDGTTASLEAVEEIVEQRALALDALTELARLPSRQRQAIVGMALDGRARAEVAGSMGLSEGAVRQLVHRARARLRTAVTAVTPWPLARWIAGAPSGGGSGVEVAAGAGAGAASSGGFVGLKLGVVLASGAIATGAAAVDIHGTRRAGVPRPAARAAAPAGLRPAARRRVQAVALAAWAPATGGVVTLVTAPATNGVITGARATPVVYRAPARSSRKVWTFVRVRHADRRREDGALAAQPPARHDGRESGGGGTDASPRAMDASVRGRDGGWDRGSGGDSRHTDGGGDRSDGGLDGRGGGGGGFDGGGDGGSGPGGGSQGGGDGSHH